MIWIVTIIPVFTDLCEEYNRGLLFAFRDITKGYLTITSWIYMSDFNFGGSVMDSHEIFFYLN